MNEISYFICNFSCSIEIYFSFQLWRGVSRIVVSLNKLTEFIWCPLSQLYPDRHNDGQHSLPSPPCGHDNVASTYIFVYVIVRVKLWRKIALNNSFYKTTIFAHFLRSFNSYLLYHCKITLCLRLTRVSRTFILLDYPGGR